MVLETSAAVAIILRENGYESLLKRLLVASKPAISAVSYMEASMVLIGKRGVGAEKELDRFLYEARVEIVPLSVTQAKIAREAFVSFGKGRHPAGLNLGIVSAMLWRSRRANHCCTKGMTLRGRIWSGPSCFPEGVVVPQAKYRDPSLRSG